MGWDLHKLFKNHSKELTRFIRREGVPEDDAPDLVQDAFIRLAVAHDGGQPTIVNPRAFLFKVSRNLATDHTRAQGVRKRYLETNPPAEVAAPAPSPEAALDFRNTIGKLETALATLSDRQRDVFLMHKFDELPHGEIAAKLGISKSMVEKHMIKALIKLRVHLNGVLD